MATLGVAYDHPSFTVIRQQSFNCQIAATGVQSAGVFRSKLKALVTGVHAIINSVGTGTIILTLTHNGSVMAVKTIGNTVEQNISSFTVTANRTLDTMVDRLDVSTPTHVTGNFTVIYEYRILPQDITTFGTNQI